MKVDATIASITPYFAATRPFGCNKAEISSAAGTTCVGRVMQSAHGPANVTVRRTDASTGYVHLAYPTWLGNCWFGPFGKSNN